MQKSSSKFFFYISIFLAILIAFIIIAIIIKPVLINNLIFVSIVLILLIIDILIFYFNESNFSEFISIDMVWSNEGARQQRAIIKKLQKFCLKIDKFLKNIVKK